MALTPLAAKHATRVKNPASWSMVRAFICWSSRMEIAIGASTAGLAAWRRCWRLGEVPIVGLADARRKRDDARRMLDAGQDPSLQRKLDNMAAAATAENTFGTIAQEHIAKIIAEGAAAATVKKNRWMLEDLCKPIHSRPITQITPAELLDLLKKVERSGRRETARRTRGTIGTVFRHAIVTLRATNDPTFALRGAVLRPRNRPRPAILDEAKFGQLMSAIDDYDGWPTIRAALKFTATKYPLVFQII